MKTYDIRSGADDDGVEVGSVASGRFKIFTDTKTTKVDNVYLSESVESNFEYAELCHKLRTAENQVNIYLSSHGGYCSSGYQLVNAIRDCPKLVTMIVDAPCYSMGAILAISGRFLVMKPHTFLMFHNYSGGAGGKGGEMVLQTHETERWLRTAYKDSAPFLTKKELDLLAKDQDVYVHWDDLDLSDRFRRHFPDIMKKYLPEVKKLKGEIK